jgi:transcriptional regulator with XRE-family HTH domain
VFAYVLALDITQIDLADKLGITYQQIQNYEKGKNRIGSSRLQHIATILKVPASSFFEGIENSVDVGATSVSFVSEYMSCSDGLRLAKAFSKIKSEALRRSIIALFEELASQFPERD